jgi:hypothetical protein
MRPITPPVTIPVSTLPLAKFKPTFAKVTQNSTNVLDKLKTMALGKKVRG